MQLRLWLRLTLAFQLPRLLGNCVRRMQTCQLTPLMTLLISMKLMRGNYNFL